MPGSGSSTASNGTTCRCVMTLHASYGNDPVRCPRCHRRPRAVPVFSGLGSCPGSSSPIPMEMIPLCGTCHTTAGGWCLHQAARDRRWQGQTTDASLRSGSAAKPVNVACWHQPAYVSPQREPHSSPHSCRPGATPCKALFLSSYGARSHSSQIPVLMEPPSDIFDPPQADAEPAPAPRPWSPSTRPRAGSGAG